MIEINLLPENLRHNKEMALGLDKIIYLAKIGFLILIAVHLLLFFVSLAYNYAAVRLEKTKAKISGEDAGSLTKEFNALTSRVKIIGELTNHKSRWSERLNKLSSLLPNGIWFNHIQAGNGNLEITGSVVSLKKNEVELLNKFLESLKADLSFYSGFKSLDIVSIGRSNLFGVEVVVFSVKGLLAE